MDTVMMIGILFLIAGFILIGVEMVVPGFGVPGISGIVCLMAGIFLTADSIEQGVLITVVVIVALGILMTIIMDTDVKAGVPIDSSDLTYLLGKEGVAATDLKPAGKGDFEGVELDIFSEGQYIKKGTRIVISKVNQKKLMVKEL